MTHHKELYNRFIEKIKFPDYEDETTDCWIWIGGKNKVGYGLIRDENGHKVTAHRISYRLFVSDFNAELCVLHRCDNPSCVNPKHLFLGTKSDNMKDMWNKQRHPTINMGRPSCTMSGENNIKARLTKEDILFIRGHYHEYRQDELAEMFHVKSPAIWKIIHKYTWKEM